MRPEVPAPPADPGTGTTPDPNKGGLKVNVPADALVYVNGILTKSTGTDRTYVSRGLLAGMKYTYEVRAEAIRDGAKIEETKVVALKAGETIAVAFSNLQPAKSVETTLTLHVPANAKVTLGGNATAGTGTERIFRTRKLAGDSAWSNYLVQVSVEQAGRTLTQERTISVKAGDNQTLTFDFNGDQVASVR
jgi:uncharacterized protein (TIGR03000 family)